MDLILEVMSILAPVLILAGIGFFWARGGYDYPVQFVTRMTMNIAVPCLIFSGLVSSEIAPAALRDIAIAGLLAYVGVAIVSAILVRALNYDQRTFLPPLVFGNTGNLGLPLAFFAFGPIGLDYAVVVFAVMAFLSFTVGVWLVSGGKSPVEAIKQPIVWATVLGAFFMMTGFSLPVWGMNTLKMTGQMAIPLMLITLGVAVTRLQPASINRAVWLSLAKVVICVGVAAGAGFWLGLPQIALAALVLQVATPVAVTSYMLAEKYDANPAEVAGLVVVSTLFSIAAIPLILAFFIV